MHIVLFVLTIAVVATAITLGIVLPRKSSGGNPDVPTVTQPAFVLPLEEFSIAQEVNLGKFIYNPSLNQWTTVTGMTFGANAGEEVKAIMDGKIIKVADSLLDGRAVVIEHTNGFVSVYKSLGKVEEETLEIGQEVTAGTTIGITSDSMAANKHFGNQLYLQLKKDDKFVDPVDYLPQINK